MTQKEPEYAVDERVLCFHGPQIYDAKVWTKNIHAVVLWNERRKRRESRCVRKSWVECESGVGGCVGFCIPFSLYLPLFIFHTLFRSKNWKWLLARRVSRNQATSFTTRIGIKGDAEKGVDLDRSSYCPYIFSSLTLSIFYLAAGTSGYQKAGSWSTTMRICRSKKNSPLWGCKHGAPLRTNSCATYSPLSFSLPISPSISLYIFPLCSVLSYLSMKQG